VLDSEDKKHNPHLRMDDRSCYEDILALLLPIRSVWPLGGTYIRPSFPLSPFFHRYLQVSLGLEREIASIHVQRFLDYASKTLRGWWKLKCHIKTEHVKGVCTKTSS
jgi:hypothetical protein